jgi:hypothetical protein
VTHAERVEQLLAAVGKPRQLPPGRELRRRLLQMRNLLAEHRDESVLYWRLTGQHTPHVIATDERLGMQATTGSIDSYEYVTEVVGGILSLRYLSAELLALSGELETLAVEYRGTGESAPPTPQVNW